MRRPTPDFTYIGLAQKAVEFLIRENAQIAHLGMLFGVAAGFALSRLGNEVGQLGQSLGRANANAAGDTRPLQDALAHQLASASHVAPNTLQV